MKDTDPTVEGFCPTCKQPVPFGVRLPAAPPKRRTVTMPPAVLIQVDPALFDGDYAQATDKD